MAQVRKFATGVAGQGVGKTASHENAVPDISSEAADRIAASAPVKIMTASTPQSGPGNPRIRRYRQKTYSLLQEDIDLIEALVAEIRMGGLHERGRSDVIRAGVRLLKNLPIQEKLKAVEVVESLKN